MPRKRLSLRSLLSKHDEVNAVQLLGRVRLCNPMDCSTPGSPSFTISQSLLRLMSIESVMPSKQLVLCCPLLLLPSMFPNKLAFQIRWPKYWSFSISPSN